MSIKTLEQGRAAFAYRCAEDGSSLNFNNKVDKAYKSYAKKIPMLIKTNGLGATFAFIKSKAKTDTSKKAYAYHIIYQQVTKWLFDCENDREFKMLNLVSETDDLIKKIINLESPEYRVITIEVLAFFGWLKRFAEGLIQGDDDGTED